ncbi:UDP-N-acetylmuramoyl-L-alanyl-D-glutamate--2,6-diaminopimelate ligase [Salinibacterium xinjiangense]|uniref:UDP-N-acetylmuramyl-tripeptide synthetase n=1 Tax=Salinibacterium xinjiangense TaxID=386302 RepID=A0A2C8Z9G1_9MICO|nr:UDP-N-acetylmuramoyl-L-alanyl-D-glutamate--2,6-diaminopimelate ligase [Salinibacterium xinjiangense]GGK91157.1 UDP-N-acetylmuramoyl-L-alanyl-D-glutamate--2,6-diaminopimelate ligase [Salinibacterium xinjiangense]SOE60640.1 UDP-N-acetylmuramoylalanyl-D-glutamate--2,6-diaminopimelate ligase [Salinibacterium xinjiangense]
MEVWSDGQAGADATPHDLDLGRYDDALTGIVVRGRRLVQDSRALEPGDVFVALGRPGAPALPWVQDALERGAAAVLVDAIDAEGALPEHVYRVAGLKTVLGRMADDFSGHPSRAMTMVGITGTNGKTSTAHLLTQAWNALGTTSATIGTLGAGVTGEPRINMGMTTPQLSTVHQFLADFVAKGVKDVAMEVSSHALEQGRVDAVEFDIVAFTNFTRDHLDYHGTMEEYAKQKAKIFTLPGISAAIVNLDDAFGREHFATIGEGIRRIGLSSQGNVDATVSAGAVELTTQGLQFDLRIDGTRHAVASSLIGRFNVDNLLAVAGVLHAQGVPASRIAETLGPLTPVVGRMTRIQPSPLLPLVVVDAGHTPDAVQHAVTALRESGHSRLVTVFGATGDRDAGKRPEMARIVEAGSDLVIVTDDDVHFEDGDQILADIRRGFEHPERVVEIRDRTTAIAYAIDAAGPDDVVLLQGKGHEPYQIIGDQRVPFSDLDTAERLLADRM